MTLDIIKEIGMYGGGVIVVLMTLIQVAPIKINPWSWLGKCIGRAINGEVIEKVETLTKDVAKNKADDDEQWASLSRTHILRFGDEIRHGVIHSKEHFDQVLLDIKKYVRYCEAHADYENDVANATIDLIREKYRKCLDENKFL